MNRTLGSACLAMAMFFLGAGQGQAQESRVIPEPGRYALSFQLPEGGGSGLGIRRMMTERINLGLEIAFDYAWSETRGEGLDLKSSGRSMGIHPDVRVYLRTTGRIVPFLLVSTGIDYAKAPDGQSFLGYFGRTGIGAEWFPFDRVSVVGSTGLGMTWGHYDRNLGRERDSFDVTMFRSAITLNLYF